jgi:CubicO group peptidase (beta-lactamase class C family)
MMADREGQAMDARAQWTGLDEKRLERIGDHLQRRYLDPGKMAGCQVAVVRHGHIAYQRAFGLMDRERGKPVRPDTLWRIYSMTKPITSVALMMLLERGLFQLDDPVARVVPSWAGQRVWVSGMADDLVTAPAQRPVSFRDLLRHTAGLTYGGHAGPDAWLPVDDCYAPAGVRGPGSDQGAEDFLDRLGHVPLAFQPGSAWLYSMATDACGALVEVLSGRPLPAFLAEEIFGPLGMKDTDFFAPPEKLDRLAANYLAQEDGQLALADDPQASEFAAPRGFASGGAGLVGTTADYLRFCEMLRRGGELDGARILGPRTIELMHANHLPGGRDLAETAMSADISEVRPGVGFGLGFAVNLGQAQSGGYGVGDYYWAGAASTLFWVDPREDLSVVFMTQLMPTGTYDLRGELKSLIYSAIVE